MVLGRNCEIYATGLIGEKPHMGRVHCNSGLKKGLDKPITGDMNGLPDHSRSAMHLRESASSRVSGAGWCAAHLCRRCRASRPLAMPCPLWQAPCRALRTHGPSSIRNTNLCHVHPLYPPGHALGFSLFGLRSMNAARNSRSYFIGISGLAVFVAIGLGLSFGHVAYEA